MKLIDKDKIVAEIEKKIMQYEFAFNNPSSTNYDASLIAKGKYRKLLDILQFINTLEVKEVDLDKMLTKFMSRYAYENGGEYPSSIDIAKYFFELGLNAQKGE